jgi:hypothetical protein
MPLRLLEPVRNDVQALLDLASDAPVWGDRRPLAKELNALTKGCFNGTTYASYDADKASDHEQSQNLVDLQSETARLQSFAYFMELYSSFYRPSTGTGTAGTLVIRERSRCGTSFPLHYVDKDAPPSTITNRDYWRNCQRLAEVPYKPDKPGFDFAQWSVGVKPGPAWVTDPPWLAPEPHTRVGAMPQYGLCALNGAPPSDGAWRGMNHHSQFKCIEFSSADPTFLVYNSCKIIGTKSVSIAGSTAEEPSFDCAVVTTPQQGQVVWGLVAYARYGAVGQLDGGATVPHPKGGVPTGELAVYPADGIGGEYVRGCINEDMEWGAMLCPSAQTPMGPADGTFGRVSCTGQFLGYVWADYKQSLDGENYNAELIWDFGRWE